MSFANNITRLCELAARNYLQGAGLENIAAANIFAGFDDDEIGTPRVVCTCASAVIDGPTDNAVWECRLEVRAISNADDVSAEEHLQFAGEVFSQFFLGRQVTIDALNNISTGFACQDIRPREQSRELTERRWISLMAFELICCGTDIP